MFCLKALQGFQKQIYKECVFFFFFFFFFCGLVEIIDLFLRRGKELRTGWGRD